MVKLLLWVLFPLFAFALTDVDRQEFVYKNIIANPGFESGTGGWSAGADTITSVTSGSNLLFGKGSITWDSAGAGRILTHTAVTIPKGAYAANGLCSYLIQVPSGTATHLIRAYDGTNVIASQTISSSTTPTVSAINFIMPSTGTIQCQLVSVAANEPLIAVDDAYVGKAYNLKQINQATLIGSAYIIGNGSCVWERTSTSLGAFTTTSACDGPTVITNNGPGTIQTTDTNLPRFTVNSLAPGTYAVRIAFSSYATNNGEEAGYVINDGTTNSPMLGSSNLGANFPAPIVLEGTFTYTSTANRTFEVYAKATAGTARIQADGGAGDMSFSIIRYPSATEVAYTPEATNWHIDATIYNVANSNYFEMGSSDISTYTAPNLADLSMVINPGSIPAKITCSSTNPPTGLTCGAGNEEAGVNFDLPVAGDVEVCAQFDHYTDTTNGFIKVNFAWQETLSNSQSSIQDCGPATVSGIDSGTQGTHHPTHVCGICHFASNGNKTIRLMRKQIHSSTVSVNAIHVIDQSAGQQQLRLIVKPLNQSMPTVLVGQTTSMRYYANTSTANSFAHNTVQIIDYNVLQWVTNLNGDVVTTGSAWKYTSLRGGEYRVTASLEIDVAPSIGANLQIHVNGTVEAYGQSSSNQSLGRFSAKVKLNAGDYIDVRIFQRNGGSTTAAINDYGGTGNRTAHFIEIEKVN